jgi:hypothetical protein
MKSVWIVDKVDSVECDVTQYGKTCSTYEEARELFAEALQDEGCYDDWDGIAAYYSVADVLYVVREIKLP